VAQRKSWEQIAELSDAQSHGLSAEEFSHLQEVLGRPLSILEIGICSALYSEHCSYKSTKHLLKTLPTTGPRVIHGPGENAGVVDIGDGLAVAFKVESHNHPSYIEPFQGAATGVGGILRDVFTMGARPIALLNSLRFGERSHPKTKYLLSRAVAGIGNYGNCVGVPTVGGELYFHKAYNGNCLVNAFALGVVRKDKIFLGQASGIGNPVMYLGAKTGRDGIHGATMSSETFGEDSDSKRPTVQVGDPFKEKLLIEACMDLMASGYVAGIQDMGAAGLTSSSFEMADRAGNGVRLDLDLVPQREMNMTPYDIMLSESQERMLLVVEKGREQKVIDIAHRWELDAVVVGEVVKGGNVELQWKGKVVSKMPSAALTRSVPPRRHPIAPIQKPAVDWQAKVPKQPSAADLSGAWLKLLESENLCSRFPVFSQYDSTVLANTVVHPGADCGVVRVTETDPKSKKGIAIKLDCNSLYCEIDPRRGTALSVIEALQNISAVGAEPLGMSDCLNFGSPANPGGMWQIAESIAGLGEAGRALGVPVVSGNVSLNNENSDGRILPTPTLAMVGLVEDVTTCVGASFQADGDVILLLGASNPTQLGGSEYLTRILGIESGPLPDYDFKNVQLVCKLVRDLVRAGLLRSCHDVSDGGLAIALSECCVSPYGARGAKLTLEGADSAHSVGVLFGQAGNRFIVSCAKAKLGDIESACRSAGVPITGRGSVGGTAIEITDFARVDLQAARDAWTSGLNELL
jgi:phosphoribosylformylglycinamidine synthase